MENTGIQGDFEADGHICRLESFRIRLSRSEPHPSPSGEGPGVGHLHKRRVKFGGPTPDGEGHDSGKTGTTLASGGARSRSRSFSIPAKPGSPDRSELRDQGPSAMALEYRSARRRVFRPGMAAGWPRRFSFAEETLRHEDLSLATTIFGMFPVLVRTNRNHGFRHALKRQAPGLLPTPAPRDDCRHPPRRARRHHPFK